MDKVIGERHWLILCSRAIVSLQNTAIFIGGFGILNQQWYIKQMLKNNNVLDKNFDAYFALGTSKFKGGVVASLTKRFENKILNKIFCVGLVRQ